MHFNQENRMKIAVAGAGYVGLSNALLLAQNHQVVLMDPIAEKVDKINNRISPIEDSEVSEHLANPNINLRATSSEEDAYSGAEYIFIAAPTNNKGDNAGFDTSHVEQAISAAKKYSPEAAIIIKSTVPIGFTQGISAKTGFNDIFFSPEFLREGKAFYDCLHPSRIIVGYSENSDSMTLKAKEIARLLLEGAKEKDAPTLIMGASEAEAVKLFSNAYLAMRISFFNELDSFSELHGLDSKEVITGMGLDSRIGLHYNNPSFGFGGYCLPKDTKELKVEYADVPHELISAIDEANATRKKFITSRIKNLEPKTVGIYRLIMKAGSDNFRESSIMDVMDGLAQEGIEVIVYEPLLQTGDGFVLENDFQSFIKNSDVIVANRITSELEPHLDKVYSRDLFREN